MYKNRLIVAFSILLIFIFGFALIYSYINSRLKINSVRIVGNQNGIGNHTTAALPEGIRILTHEEYLRAMEEETRALTDAAFRQAIEGHFNPNNPATRFFFRDEDDTTSIFRGDDSIYER